MNTPFARLKQGTAALVLASIVIAIGAGAEVNAFVAPPGASDRAPFVWRGSSGHSSWCSALGMASTDSTTEKEGPFRRLSHTMLRVPDVSATVEYWKSRGATVTSYNKKAATENAFVTLGNGREESGEGGGKKDCFSLEITNSPRRSGETEAFQLGDGLQYLGTSMLLDFQNNLVGAAAGEKLKSNADDEPNGIQVQRVAAAPGDFLSRVCLAVSGGEAGLTKTARFYNELLGMETSANEAGMLCLRCKGRQESYGVPTTLVFVSKPNLNEIDHGNCFDHIVIETSSSIEEEVDRIKSMPWVETDVIFMKKTRMFGRMIVGLTDPSGYKVYLIEENS
jgi:catechol 2,3-dioxygenase-like lactoylglutathione lyase family enzyme